MTQYVYPYNLGDDKTSSSAPDGAEDGNTWQRAGTVASRVVSRSKRRSIAAADLKTAIVDAALAGHFTTTEAEDLISYCGLRSS